METDKNKFDRNMEQSRHFAIFLIVAASIYIMYMIVKAIHDKKIQWNDSTNAYQRAEEEKNELSYTYDYET